MDCQDLILHHFFRNFTFTLIPGACKISYIGYIGIFEWHTCHFTCIDGALEKKCLFQKYKHASLYGVWPNYPVQCSSASYRSRCIAPECLCSVVCLRPSCSGFERYDDFIKWNRFPRYCHSVTHEFPHKGQWRGPWMFSLICAWINARVNNRRGGDLIRHRPQYDVIVMTIGMSGLMYHHAIVVGVPSTYSQDNSCCNICLISLNQINIQPKLCRIYLIHLLFTTLCRVWITTL